MKPLLEFTNSRIPRTEYRHGEELEILKYEICPKDRAFNTSTSFRRALSNLFFMKKEKGQRIVIDLAKMFDDFLYHDGSNFINAVVNDVGNVDICDMDLDNDAFLRTLFSYASEALIYGEITSGHLMTLIGRILAFYDSKPQEQGKSKYILKH